MDRGKIVAEGEPEQLKGELHGDAIAVELREPPQDGEVDRAVARVQGVRDVSVEGRALRARADSGARPCRPCWRRWSPAASPWPR